MLCWDRNQVGPEVSDALPASIARAELGDAAPTSPYSTFPKGRSVHVADALRTLEINPVLSSPKAMASHGDLCVIGLEARAEAAA